MTARGARPGIDGSAGRRDRDPYDDRRCGAGHAGVPRPGRHHRKVGRLTKEAAANGARLAAFPEGFVPTYPDWVWRTRPWQDDEWYARWVDQCVDVPGSACDALA